MQEKIWILESEVFRYSWNPVRTINWWSYEALGPSSQKNCQSKLLITWKEKSAFFKFLMAHSGQHLRSDWKKCKIYSNFDVIMYLKWLSWFFIIYTCFGHYFFLFTFIVWLKHCRMSCHRQQAVILSPDRRNKISKPFKCLNCFAISRRTA